VHGIKNAGLDGIKHFECTDNGTGRKAFEYNLTFRRRRDFLAKLLELDEAQRPGIPCSLYLECNGSRSRCAHHGRKTNRARSSAGHSRCLKEFSTGHLLLFRLLLFLFLNHG
jgi:hypothetical protein